MLPLVISHLTLFLSSKALDAVTFGARPPRRAGGHRRQQADAPDVFCPTQTDRAANHPHSYRLGHRQLLVHHAGPSFVLCGRLDYGVWREYTIYSSHSLYHNQLLHDNPRNPNDLQLAMLRETDTLGSVALSTFQPDSGWRLLTEEQCRGRLNAMAVTASTTHRFFVASTDRQLIVWW